MAAEPLLLGGRERPGRGVGVARHERGAPGIHGGAADRRDAFRLGHPLGRSHPGVADAGGLEPHDDPVADVLDRVHLPDEVALEVPAEGLLAQLGEAGGAGVFGTLVEAPLLVPEVACLGVQLVGPAGQGGGLARQPAPAAHHREAAVGPVYGEPGGSGQCRSHPEGEGGPPGQHQAKHDPEAGEGGRKKRPLERRPLGTERLAARCPRARLCLGHPACQDRVERRHPLQRQEAGRAERFGQRTGGLDPAQVREQRRLVRREEVVGGKQEVLARRVAVPEHGLGGEGPKRGVDDESGKAVEVRPRVALGAVGVLVVAVADLRRGRAVERGHDEGVVIDEGETRPAVGFANEHVAVLEVAVGESVRLEIGEHPAPGLGQRRHPVRLGVMPGYVAAERLALGPVHHDERVRRAADAHAARLVVETDGVGQRGFAERLRDLSVAPLLRGHLRQQAPHGHAAFGRLGREDGSEGAGDRLRQTERPGLDGPGREDGIGERLVGELEGVLVVTGRRVGHVSGGGGRGGSRRRCACRPHGRSRRTGRRRRRRSRPGRRRGRSGGGRRRGHRW